MSQRPNAKFLILVISAVVVVVGVAGLFFTYRMLTDPERNIARGQELEQSGDYLSAMRTYGRAVAKQRTNPTYLDHMQRALLKIVPPTSEEARQHYEMNLQVLRQRAVIQPRDPEPWKRLIEAFEERALFLQNPGAWQQVVDAANDMLREVPKGSEGEQYARSAVALATAQRDAHLTEAEREKNEQLLREVVAADPKNARAWNALLSLLLNDANRTFLANQLGRSRERIDQFNAALKDAEAAIPDSAVVPIAKAKFIRSQVTRDDLPIPDALAKLGPVLEAVDRAARAPDASLEIKLNAIDQLLATNNKNDSQRAIEIIEEWLTRHPNDVVMKRLLSIAMRRVDLDRAIAVAQSIIDTPRSTVSLWTAFHDEVRAESADRIFDIAMSRAEAATDSAERAEHVRLAEKMRDLIAELGRNMEHSPRLLKAEARLALFAGDKTGAASKMDRVFALVEQPDMETYLLATEIALQRNEFGLGLSYVNRGIDRLGASYPLLMARARIEIGMRRADDALKTANALLELQPDDPIALQIRDAAQKMISQLSPEAPTDPLMQGLQDSERRLFEQDVAGAQAIIEKLLTTHGDDPRVQAQAGRLDLIAGDTARAIERLDRALALRPNDPTISQLRAIASTTDPVERVNKLVELNVADEKQRPAMRYVTIMSVIVALKKDLAAGGRGPDGSLRNLDEIRASLARFEAELPAAREAAMASGSTNPGVLYSRFDEAVLRRDFVGAEKVGIDAEQSGDRALGAFLRARAMSLQDRHRDAREHLEKQIQQGVNSAEMLMQLGYAREMLGDIPAALLAYKEAYERRPSDLATLSSYADLLRRTGEVRLALQLFREAAKTSVGDERVINTWLMMEDGFGDRSHALCWRRKLYREQPSDRENALRLAVMLTDGQADHRLLLKPGTCDPKYTDTEWASLPVNARSQEIQAMLKANQAEGVEIFKRLLSANPADFEVALQQANMMQRLGHHDDAEALLRDVVSKADVTQAGPLWFGLGQFLADQGLQAKAIEAFEQARSLQDPVEREADLALSDFWFNRFQWQRAHDALKSALETREAPPPLLLRRMGEILVKLRRVDEAEKVLQQAREADPDARFEAVYEVLKSNIAVVRGEDLWTSGNKDAAKVEFEKAEAALVRAIELQPGSAIPWFSLAALQRDMYVRGRDPAVIKRALTSVEKGIQMASTMWSGVHLYAEILHAMGDLPGATLVIEKYLTVSGGNVEARKYLADLYLQAGNPQRAINVLDEGAILQPSDPLWPMAIGELQLRRGAHREAIMAFDRALQISPSPFVLARTIEARTRVSPPEWRSIIDLNRQHRAEIQGDPAMRSMFGAALYNTGDRQNGLQVLKEVGRALRKGGAADSARSADVEAWYTALRHVFPPSRTDELEALVTEVAGEPGLSSDDVRRLAMLWTEVGPEGFPQVSKYLAEARKHIDSEDALYRSLVWLAIGNLEFVQNNCDAAIEAFEKVIVDDPGSATALNNLGFLVSKCRGEHAKGVELARRAVAMAPGQSEFLDTLGHVLFRNGEFAEAQTVLERAIRVSPQPIIYVHLAQVLAATEKKAEAMAALDKAIDLKPSDDVRKQAEELRRTLN